jgi:predicted ester cyclase
MSQDIVEQNAHLVRRFEEEFWLGNFDLGPQLLDANFVRHGGAGKVVGINSYIDFIKMTYELMPDFHHKIEDLVANDKAASVRVSVKGTFMGTYKGVAGKGQRLEYTAFDFLKIRAGKIYEMWGCFDTFTLFRKLGVIDAMLREDPVS